MRIINARFHSLAIVIPLGMKLLVIIANELLRTPKSTLEPNREWVFAVLNLIVQCIVLFSVWLSAPAEQAAIYPWQVLVPFFNRCDITSGVESASNDSQRQQPPPNQHISKHGNSLNRSLEGSVNPRAGGVASNGEINANYLLNGGGDDQGLNKMGDTRGTVASEETEGSRGDAIECNTEAYDDGAVSDCLSTDPGNCSQSGKEEMKNKKTKTCHHLVADFLEFSPELLQDAAS